MPTLVNISYVNLDWSILAILGLSSLITALSGSSINLSLPEIANDLDISSSSATWIILVGLITSSIFLVMFGYIGDLISKVSVFIYGNIIFTLGSAIGGMAPTFALLLIGRVIQAVGISMIMANSMGITTEYFSDKERAEALTTISMFVSVGSISGPAFVGIIISIFSWRWLLLINIPLEILISWLSFKILKNKK